MAIGEKLRKESLRNLLLCLNALTILTAIGAVGWTIFVGVDNAERREVPRVLRSFVIAFDPNDREIKTEGCEKEVRLAIQQATNGDRISVVIRGHADPTDVLQEFLKEGMRTGTVRRVESDKDAYYYNDKVIHLDDTKRVLEAIQSGEFEGAADLARQAVKFSQDRADRVRGAVKEYARKCAESKQIDLKDDQFISVGVGISEPIFPLSKTFEEAKQNMRVEVWILAF